MPFDWRGWICTRSGNYKSQKGNIVILQNQPKSSKTASFYITTIKSHQLLFLTQNFFFNSDIPRLKIKKKGIGFFVHRTNDGHGYARWSRINKDRVHYRSWYTLIHTLVCCNFFFRYWFWWILWFDLMLYEICMFLCVYVGYTGTLLCQNGKLSDVIGELQVTSSI